MADLIVDFPSQHHHDESCPSDQTNHAQSVRFSNTCEVLVVNRHSKSDARNIWYSENNLQAMKMKHRRDIRDVQKIIYLLSLTDDADSLKREEAMDGMELFGIENLVSPELVKKRLGCRALCRRAVVIEQARQNDLNECDPVRMATIAQRHSEWSVRRAGTVGLIQDRYGS